MDGLQSWSIAFNQTNSTAIVINRSLQTRTTTQTAPDGSYSIQVETSGRPTSNTRYSASGTVLARITFAYDEHGRQKDSIDDRNGTTRTVYNTADLVASVTTPDPGNGQIAQIISTS